MNRCLFTLILLLLLSPGVGHADSVKAGQANYPKLLILTDATKALGVNDVVRSNGFAEGRPIIGFKDTHLWVKFTVDNPGSEALRIVLEDQWALTNLIDIFRLDAGQVVQHIALGHKSADDPTRALHRYPFTYLDLPPGSHEFLIQYRTNDIVGCRLALWLPNDFEHYKLVSQLIYGLLLGAILVMSLYNFFLFLALRYPSYFYYASYSFLFFFFQMCITGFMAQLTGQYGWWTDEGTVVFASVTVVFVVLFTQAFLQLKIHSMLLYRLGFIVAALALGAMTLTFFDFQDSTLCLVAANVAVASWIVVCSLYTTFKRVPEGKVFLLAWGFFVIGDIGTVFYYTGFAQANVFTLWGMITGSVTEIVLLSFGLASFVNRMKAEMQAAKETLNRELAQNLIKVEAQVQEKTRDIRLILQNIQQGIFTLYGERLLVHEEHSRALLPIIGEKQVAGRSFQDMFLQNTRIGADHQNQITATLQASLDEDVDSFEVNSHILPKELHYGRIGESDRILELYWEPMINADAQVDRILVTVRDVTLDREMQARAREQTEEMNIIGEIVQRDPRLFGSFLKTTGRFLQRAYELLNAGSLTADAPRELYRILHTIKGNARAQRLADLASAVHLCEERLQQYIDHPQQHTFGVEDVEAVDAKLEPFVRVFDKRFGGQFDQAKISLSTAAATRILEYMQQQGVGEKHELMQELVQETLFSMRELVKEMKSEGQRLATELGKEPPAFEESFESVFVSQEFYEVLSHIFGHLLRNSLDHGIETAAERQAAGKSGFGTIALRYAHSPRSCLLWRDDGRGLDLASISRRALEKGLIRASNGRLPVDVCQKVIFGSGFSTKQESTQISGRGVGLDAVVSLLENVGGRLELHYVGDWVDGRYQAFEFLLWLPEHQVFALSAHHNMGAAS